MRSSRSWPVLLAGAAAMFAMAVATFLLAA
jgi:hypothetical protein